MANEAASNWNQKHYNIIPINHHGLGGKMQTAHAKQILLESYNNLKLNQVQQQYAQKKVENIPAKEEINLLSFRAGNTILKSHKIGLSNNKRDMVNKLIEHYYPQV